MLHEYKGESRSTSPHSICDSLGGCYNKSSLHNSNKNNNNQCDLEDKAQLCSMFPRFERLYSIQQEQGLSSKYVFKRMKYEKYIIICNILLGHVDSLSLNVIT